ncbi:hypothetical protein HMPREF9103_00330 [Lentilactobacillus parafarraginis F0439]|uniref:Uncharacterized protein n=1 Tax=Lentilactobacillus parafarraginis F0439 TaxID=797515 RepID=G9ZKT2_9LACO|nr:hypothetical protein HMPREF9103_00330 [Lentilactobacillus parafarraginis F0439]
MNRSEILKYHREIQVTSITHNPTKNSDKSKRKLHLKSLRFDNRL